ncbi:hypothetical protein CDCA_CDCA10G2964 [Cyanidium caldarium]|uniref:Myosin motor domain-containing protein n=1 Tax=Cyanidium caldarium TaxID=2771 RepID=A0AAV9IXE0_CYACA|nr:hypothetical protein CDCA_CDCA10G2964 [Cyanidium caldarium]
MPPDEPTAAIRSILKRAQDAAQRLGRDEGVEDEVEDVADVADVGSDTPVPSLRDEHGAVSPSASPVDAPETDAVENGASDSRKPTPDSPAREDGLAHAAVTRVWVADAADGWRVGDLLGGSVAELGTALWNALHGRTGAGVPPHASRFRIMPAGRAFDPDADPLHTLESMVQGMRGVPLAEQKRRRSLSPATLVALFCHPFDADDTTDPRDDAIELRNLHTAPVLDLFRRRFHAEPLPHLYTFVGADLLVSINPFRPLPALYAVPVMQQAVRTPDVPHLYGIGECALQSLQGSGGGEPQAFLVSGVSGAGKTVAYTRLLEYFCWHSQQLHSHDDAFAQTLLCRLVASNPVLEAFGNATTALNDNSSRFGRLLQLVYRRGVIVGAHLRHFMLESSRVVGRCGRMSHDDANFHVFYYLVVGALRGSPTEYRYLYAADAGRGDPASANTRTANAELHAAELRARYHEVLAAMQALELPVEDIMRLLLAILLLGNIEFGSDDGDGSDLDGCYVRRLDVAAQVAELLEVDLTRLEEALVSRTISVRGEHFRRRHSVEEAEEARDALAKVLYRAVFDAIVTGIDRQLKQPQTPTEAEVEDEDEEGYIFLLDQTGFESGEFNSLEQLLINYGNEKLQEQFGDNVAVAEMDILAREGILFDTPIAFPHNRDRVVALEYYGGLLDEECVMPRGTEQRFFDKLCYLLEADAASAVTLDVSDEARLRTARQFLSVPRVRRDDTEFTVHHFAGDVTYGVRDLVKKNRDSLPVALVDVMSVSRWRFLAELMEDVDTQRNVPSPVRGNGSAGSAGSGGGHSGSRRSKGAWRTIWSEYRRQTDELMTILRACKPRYIRCIKPNTEKRPRLLMAPYVLDQLQRSGVLEYVHLRRSGLPVRFPWLEFCRRYQALFADGSLQSPGNRFAATDTLDMHRADIEGMLRRELNEDALLVSATPGEETARSAAPGWRIGYTRVFLSDAAHKHLEHKRLRLYQGAALRLVRYLQAASCRLRFVRLRAAARRVAATARARRQRTEYHHLRRVALRLQATLRARRARGALQQLRSATMVVQRHTRQWLQRHQQELQRRREARQQAAEHAAASRIAAVVRARPHRRTYMQLQGAARTVSRRWHLILLHRRLCDLNEKHKVIRLQAQWRRALALRHAARRRRAIRTLQRHALASLTRRRYLRELAASWRGPHPGVVLLTGVTEGVGKSALINLIAGHKVAPLNTDDFQARPTVGVDVPLLRCYRAFRGRLLLIECPHVEVLSRLPPSLLERLRCRADAVLLVDRLDTHAGAPRSAIELLGVLLGESVVRQRCVLVYTHRDRRSAYRNGNDEDDDDDEDMCLGRVRESLDPPMPVVALNALAPRYDRTTLTVLGDLFGALCRRDVGRMSGAEVATDRVDALELQRQSWNGSSLVELLGSTKAVMTPSVACDIAPLRHAYVLFARRFFPHADVQQVDTALRCMALAEEMRLRQQGAQQLQMCGEVAVLLEAARQDTGVPLRLCGMLGADGDDVSEWVLVPLALNTFALRCRRTGQYMACLGSGASARAVRLAPERAAHTPQSMLFRAEWLSHRRVAFRSVQQRLRYYLCANRRAHQMTCDKRKRGAWETFQWQLVGAAHAVLIDDWCVLTGGRIGCRGRGADARTSYRQRFVVQRANDAEDADTRAYREVHLRTAEGTPVGVDFEGHLTLAPQPARLLWIHEPDGAVSLRAAVDDLFEPRYLSVDLRLNATEARRARWQVRLAID